MPIEKSLLDKNIERSHCKWYNHMTYMAEMTNICVTQYWDDKYQHQLEIWEEKQWLWKHIKAAPVLGNASAPSMIEEQMHSGRTHIHIVGKES